MAKVVQQIQLSPFEALYIYDVTDDRQVTFRFAGAAMNPKETCSVHINDNGICRLTNYPDYHFHVSYLLRVNPKLLS